MPTLEIDGCPLYYEVHGKGEVLVFAHGVGGNHAHWYNQIAHFSDRYQVIVFDHRGFGNSRDPGGPGRSRFVADLRALLDSLNVERATLVAQSMGGGTCLGFTAAYPERVNALVMADTVIGFELPEPVASEYAVVRREVENLSQVERVVGETTRRQNKAGAQLYLEMASFNVVDRRSLGGDFSPRCRPEELASLGVPVLFIVGEEDILAPPRIVSAVHRLVTGSRLVEVPRAGHSAYFEAPEVFNRALEEFLAEVGVSGRS